MIYLEKGGDVSKKEFKHSKVLVGCIVYNEEKKIKQFLEQLASQTYTFFDLVIFDNCSTDKTLDIIKNFKALSVKIISNDKNQGSYTNYLLMVDFAIKHTAYDYFLFGDVDDLYDKNYLRILVKILEENHQSVVAMPSCLVHLTNINGDIIRTQQVSYSILENRLSVFKKSFCMINETNRQFCMLVRSLIRQKYLSVLLPSYPCYYSVEEFVSVIAMYLGGISTTHQVLHTKYAVQAPVVERKLADLEDIYDLSSYSKKTKVLLDNFCYIINLHQLKFSDKIKITFLLFYRLFMR